MRWMIMQRLSVCEHFAGQIPVRAGDAYDVTGRMSFNPGKMYTTTFVSSPEDKSSGFVFCEDARDDAGEDGDA